MRRSQVTEQRQRPTREAGRERRFNSPPHGRRIFWSVLAAICWLFQALVWVLVFHGHPLRLLLGLFVTRLCVYVIMPLILGQRARSASQAEPQPSRSSTYEQGYRGQSAGATREIPAGGPHLQSGSPWAHEPMAIDYPELPPPY
jgi:hypothetical protein